MVKTMLNSSTCTEITVEDPSEAFDDLRDFRDYARLTSNGTFAQIKLNSSIDPKLSTNKIGVRVPTSHLLDMPLLKSLRTKNKIAPRQFYRLVEMKIFSEIPKHVRSAGPARLTQRGRSTNTDDRTFYYWRLLVKQRVYKQNKDVLIQLDRLDRCDKVDQSVGEIVGDYERLLNGMQKWNEAEERSDERKVGEAEASEPRQPRAKRKIIDDDDEEAEGIEMATFTPKRARSEAL